MWPDRQRHHVGPSSLEWPFPPGILLVLLAWVGWSWWREIAAQTAAAGNPEPITVPATMAWLGLVARALATLTEAGCYVLWWKGRGARLPFWRFSAWVATLSAADLLGFALRRAAIDAPDALRWLCVVLAGPGALDPEPIARSSAASAFGNFGVLTLLRIGMTAWAQARGTGRSLRGPVAMTAAAWLLTRLAAWWSFDLLRGMSPVR